MLKRVGPVLVLLLELVFAPVVAVPGKGSFLRELQGGEEQLAQLDLFFVIDQSASISAANMICVQQTGKTCWILSAQYFADIVRTVRDIFGWADVTEGLVNEIGLGIALFTFSCSPMTKMPVSFNLTDNTLVYNNDAFLGLTYYMVHNLAPLGGTCPSDSLQFTLNLALDQPEYRPNQMVVFLTDGLVEPSNINATKAVANEIQDADIGVAVISVGRENGWDEDSVRHLFGDTAILLAVDDFASLTESIPEFSKEIFGMFGASNNAHGDIDLDGKGTNPDSSSKTGAIAGSLLGVIFLFIIPASIFYVRKRARRRENKLQMQSRQV